MLNFWLYAELGRLTGEIRDLIVGQHDLKLQIEPTTNVDDT